MHNLWKLLALPVVLGALIAAAPAEETASDLKGVDRIVVYKQKHELQLWASGNVLRSYKVALGPDPVGPKVREGDGRTPEGIYTIVGHNPKSSYHLSLRISYPNTDDRARAAKLGVSPGGNIMIHGLPNSFGWFGNLRIPRDWTAGCIALSNHEIEEIYAAVADNTVVEIRP
jgi:murein L,D-transpeptidase YafK